MSIFVAMRGLTLQQNQPFLCPLQIRSFQHANLYHVLPSSVLTNGKIYGTVVREINFILFTPTELALPSIAKNISRYDSVLLNILRIGHSRLTHSYLLSGDDSPTCQSCGIPLTVKHIGLLLECANLRDIREKYFLQTYLTELTIIL